MELRQLRYLVAVVEEGSFTAAARRLHLSQPGLSAQIRALEREVGQELVDRGNRAVVPTHAGRAVLTHARAALEAAERVSLTAAEFSGLLRGHVRIGTISGATADFDLAGLLAGFHRAHPGVVLSLTEDSSDAMMRAVATGDLDLALASLTGAGPPAGLDHAVVLRTRITAVVAAADGTLGRSVRLEDLRGHRLICLSRGAGVRGVFDQACRRVGLSPDIAFEAAAPPLLVGLAAYGLGVAILPEMDETYCTAMQVRSVPIIEPELHGALALVWRSNRPAGPAVLALRDAMLAEWASGRPPVSGTD